MTKSVKITIPAGTVAADVPFYLLYVDFSKFPSTFWTDSYNNGADIRAYATNHTTQLPQYKMNRFSTVTKTGGMYVRTPVKAAVDTDVYIDYNTLGLSAIPDSDPFGRTACFAGFLAFAHNFAYVGAGIGGASLINMVTGAALDIVGTINDGDGPNDCFTFSGSGGYVRTTLAAKTVFSTGVAAIKNPGGSGDMTALAYGEELRFHLSSAAAAVYNGVDGYTDGSAYTIGQKIAIGATHNGATARALFTDGSKTIDTGVDGLSATQFAFGASYDASHKLRGAIRHAFVYDGLLSNGYFEAENFIHGSGTGGTVGPEVPVPEDYDVILWAGTSISDLTFINGTSAASTAGGRFDAAKTNESFQIDGNNATTQGTVDFAATSEAWLAFDLWWNVSGFPNGINGFLVGLGNKLFSSGVSPLPMFKVVATAAIIQLQYWNGSAYVAVGSTYDLNGITSTVTRFDFHVKMDDTGGVIELYKDGALLLTSGFIDTITTAYATLDRAMFNACRTSNSSTAYAPCFSCAFISDVTTRQMNFYRMATSALGTDQQMTGNLASVNKTGINDTTYLTAATAGLTSTFNTTDLPAGPTASTLEAVVLSSRAQVGGSAPTKIDGVTKISGTNYPVASAAPAPSTFGVVQHIMSINPATGQPWTGVQANAAEFGVKSVA